MAITADILTTPPPIVGVAATPVSRPAIAPASEREAARDARRESSRNPNGPLSFRAALDAATIAGFARATTPDAPAVDLNDHPANHRVVRAAKVPEAGPVELSGTQANDLFAQAIANNERKGRDPMFAAAASLYTASYFAGSSFLARAGEALELTA